MKMIPKLYTKVLAILGYSHTGSYVHNYYLQAVTNNIRSYYIRQVEQVAIQSNSS